MDTGNLKETHEIEVSRRFLALYNPGHQRSWAPERSGRPPEPDVICTERSSQSLVLGIEVTTAWLNHMGSGVGSLDEILQPHPGAPRMTPAKFVWEHSRGKNLPPIYAGDLVSQPNQQAITKLAEAVAAKMCKRYGGCHRTFLIVEWEYWATDENIVNEAIKHFAGAALSQCPFEEVWILTRLSNLLGREAIFRIHPSPEGPLMEPEVNPCDVL